MAAIDPEELRYAIEEATAAFDAANHAFGRFVTYAVRPHNEPVPPAVQTVRESLQDAALSVPQEQSEAAAREFLGTLQTALDAVTRFLQQPPAGYALEEAMAAPGALEEAIDVLQRVLGSVAK